MREDPFRASFAVRYDEVEYHDGGSNYEDIPYCAPQNRFDVSKGVEQDSTSIRPRATAVPALQPYLEPRVIVATVSGLGLSALEGVTSRVATIMLLRHITRRFSS